MIQLVLHFYYKNQAVTAIQGNYRCLFWEPYKIYNCSLWAECAIFENEPKSTHVKLLKHVTEILFNPQPQCILYIGQEYRYLPVMKFYIFRQKIWLLNFLRHTAQSVAFSPKNAIEPSGPWNEHLIAIWGPALICLSSDVWATESCTIGSLGE